MEIYVNKLKEALAIVEPAVAKRKPKLAILSHFLLREGELVASNMELRISVGLMEARGLSQRGLALPFDLVSEMLRHLPGAAVLSLELDTRNNLANFRCETLNTRVVGSRIGGNEPAFEMVDAEPRLAGQVDGDQFSGALLRMVPYCARNSARPVLGGVNLRLGVAGTDTSQDPPEVAAADGNRLIVQPLPGMKLGPVSQGPADVVIPASAVVALGKVWKLAPKPPTVLPSPFRAPEELGGKTPSMELADLASAVRLLELRVFTEGPWAQFRFGAVTVQTGLIEGVFPNYRQVIPSGFSRQVVFDAGEGYRALRTLAPFTAVKVKKEELHIVELTWEKEELVMSAEGEGQGSVRTTLPARVEGEGGRIAFDHGYLTEYLKGKEGLVMLEANGPNQPGRMTHGRSPDVILMPVRLKKWQKVPAPTNESTRSPDPEEALAEAMEASHEEEPAVDEPLPSRSAPVPVKGKGRGRTRKPETNPLPQGEMNPTE